MNSKTIKSTSLKNKTIALISIPAIFLMSTFSIANADETQKTNWDESEHHDQDKRGKHSAKKAEKKLKRLAKKLDLTEQQQTQVKALFEEQQAARKASGEGRKALHEAIRNLDPNAADYSQKLADVKQKAGLAAGNKIDSMMTMKQSMQKILTPEQLQKMEEMHSDRKGKKGKHNS